MSEISVDTAKNERNIFDRGLPFTLARDFEWESALIFRDDRRNYGEPRFKALGYIDGRLFVLVYTPRFPAIHVISLRTANAAQAELPSPERPVLLSANVDCAAGDHRVTIVMLARRTRSRRIQFMHDLGGCDRRGFGRLY